MIRYLLTFKMKKIFFYLLINLFIFTSSSAETKKYILTCSDDGKPYSINLFKIAPGKWKVESPIKKGEPVYNVYGNLKDGIGKDHWPIGSYLVMERGAPWGDRVAGLTDELHFAKPIDPVTLQESANGVIMTPAHVHKALQEYLGLDLYASDAGFDLRDVESLPLFDPFVMS